MAADLGTTLRRDTLAADPCGRQVERSQIDRTRSAESPKKGRTHLPFGHLTTALIWGVKFIALSCFLGHFFLLALPMTYAPLRNKTQQRTKRLLYPHGQKTQQVQVDKEDAGVSRRDAGQFSNATTQHAATAYATAYATAVVA